MKTQGVNRSVAIREYVANHKGQTSREVVEALGKQGVKVSTRLVLIATKGKGIKVNRRKSGKKTGKKTASNPDNMSARIREYADAHADHSPKEVQEGLQKMGVEVSYSLVKAVMTRHRGGPQKNRKYSKKGSKNCNFGTLKAGLEFIKVCGSHEAAQENLALLVQIRTAK